MLKTIALTVDTPNLNNRVYPRYVVENALIKAQDAIKNDRLFVTSDIPETMAVNLQDVVGIVKEVFLDRDNLIVEVQFLDNHLGNIFEQQLKKGSVSLRPNGVGTLQRNDKGENVVDDDYEIISFSLTTDPS